MAAWGLTAADYAGDTVEVWPCHVPALELFLLMRTQWRVGMSGPTGLDYNVLFHALDRMALPPADYDALLDDIRVMESAALEEIHRKPE